VCVGEGERGGMEGDRDREKDRGGSSLVEKSEDHLSNQNFSINHPVLIFIGICWSLEQDINIKQWPPVIFP